MELDDLKSLKDLNELDLLYKLITIADSCRKDTEKVLKGEKEPGIRVRRKLQDIRTLCQIMRDEIQLRKGTTWEFRMGSALDREIKIAEKKEIKDKEMIAKKKQERVSRLRK